MAITSKQRRYLRAQAHHLKAVVQLGSGGLTDAIVTKVTIELEIHELLKIKVNQDAPESAREVAPQLAAATSSESVQVIGRTIVLYKAREEEPTIRLPKASSAE